MSTENTQVVIGFDFSRGSRTALERAIALATRAPFHVLHFICVVDPHSAFPAVPSRKIDLEYTERVQEAVNTEIARELAAANTNRRVHYFVHTPIGKPVEEILRLARSVGAELILVGTADLHGIERAMLGSVAEHIVREAGCTVEVVRPSSYPYVPLLRIVENQHPIHKYAPPHRYTYEDHRAERRPADWPLY